MEKINTDFKRQTSVVYLSLTFQDAETVTQLFKVKKKGSIVSPLLTTTITHRVS